MSTNKQSITAADMATLAISYTTRRSLDHSLEDINDIHQAFDDNNDGQNKDRITSLLLLSDLAITTYLYMGHFKDNQSDEEIMHIYENILIKCINDLFGKDDYDNARRLFAEILDEYVDAFEDKDWSTSISKTFQHWLICKIKDLQMQLLPKDKNLYMLDMAGTLSCFNHVAIHIEGLREMLSKHEVSLS